MPSSSSSQHLSSSLSARAFCMLLCVLLAICCTCSPSVSATAAMGGARHPHKIALVRRDGDFDDLLADFRAKGSRMRFGKRSPPPPVPLRREMVPPSPPSAMEMFGTEFAAPMYADRYMWLN